jgi:hypothetical protein
MQENGSFQLVGTILAAQCTFTLFPSTSASWDMHKLQVQQL